MSNKIVLQHQHTIYNNMKITWKSICNTTIIMIFIILVCVFVYPHVQCPQKMLAYLKQKV